MSTRTMPNFSFIRQHVTTFAGLATAAFFFYCIYFDYRRRSAPDYKQKIRQNRRANASKNKKQKPTLNLRDPTSVQTFFLQEVQLGEELMSYGDIEEGINHLCNAIAICGHPEQLIQIFHQTLPEEQFNMLIQKMPEAKTRLMQMFGDSLQSDGPTQMNLGPMQEQVLIDTDDLEMVFDVVVSQDGNSHKLGELLGHGGYGLVYRSKWDSGIDVAVKIQAQSHAENEIDVLQSVVDCTHFCRLIDHGQIGQLYFIAMQLIGSNLSYLRNRTIKKHFTLSTAVRLGMQCLHAIEELHSVGFVSRDIKPSNFAIGLPGANQRLVYMLDFGIAIRQNNNTSKSTGSELSNHWWGTSRYCSLNNHWKKEQSPRDDIESWYYFCVEFTVGKLPWSQLPRTEKEAIAECKLSVRRMPHRETFLRGCPKIFDHILEVIDEWNAQSMIDYDGLFVSLADILMHENIQFDEPYDWEDVPAYQLMNTIKIS